MALLGYDCESGFNVIKMSSTVYQFVLQLLLQFGGFPLLINKSYTCQFSSEEIKNIFPTSDLTFTPISEAQIAYCRFYTDSTNVIAIDRGKTIFKYLLNENI